jgi:hypothetical protein
MLERFYFYFFLKVYFFRLYLLFSSITPGLIKS